MKKNLESFVRYAFLLLPLSLLPGLVGASSTSPQPEQTPARTDIQCPWAKKKTHFLIEGDLLYWVPEASGLDTYFGTGTVTHTTSGSSTVTITKEKDTDPSFKWNPGYRIILGWQFDRNLWQLGGSWTAFNGSGHVSADDGKWKVRLKQIDVAALYNTCLGSSLTLQPFFGLRGTSIWQKVFSEVDTDVIYPGTGTGTDTRTFNDRQQFYGLGPLFGLNWDYDVKYGLSVFGSIGLALLYGNYHLHFNDTEVVTPPATPTEVFSTIKKDMSAFDFNLDLGIGVQWKYLIRDTCYLIMKLGFENHQYFDQSRLGRTFGNVSFSGGVFSLGVDF